MYSMLVCRVYFESWERGRYSVDPIKLIQVILSEPIIRNWSFEGMHCKDITPIPPFPNILMVIIYSSLPRHIDDDYHMAHTSEMTLLMNIVIIMVIFTDEVRRLCQREFTNIFFFDQLIIIPNKKAPGPLLLFICNYFMKHYRLLRLFLCSSSFFINQSPECYI